MMNTKVRTMQATNGMHPTLVVLLEDGRMFKLRGHEDDDSLRWVQLPDFPESAAQRGARLVAMMEADLQAGGFGA